MMVITRKVGQKVYIKVNGHRVVLKVIDVKGSIVRLGLLASEKVVVDYTLKESLDDARDREHRGEQLPPAPNAHPPREVDET